MSLLLLVIYQVQARSLTNSLTHSPMEIFPRKNSVSSKPSRRLPGHFVVILKLNILKETNVGKDFKLSAQGNASVRQLWLSVKSTLFNAALTVESG